MALPESFRDIFWGECRWSLSRLVGIVQAYQEWIEVLSRAVDTHDRIWYDKLAFISVANGDNVAFDFAQPNAPVIYLSHADGEGHGVQLGNDFIDYIERASLIGFPGYDDWLMLPFLPSITGGLDPYGENARKWREWFGLDFEVTL